MMLGDRTKRFELQTADAHPQKTVTSFVQCLPNCGRVHASCSLHILAQCTGRAWRATARHQSISNGSGLVVALLIRHTLEFAGLLHHQASILCCVKAVLLHLAHEGLSDAIL